MKNTILTVAVTLTALMSSIGKADMICNKIDDINYNAFLYKDLRSDSAKKRVARRIQKDVYDIYYQLKTAEPKQLRKLVDSHCVTQMPFNEFDAANDRLIDSEFDRFEEVELALIHYAIAISVGGLVSTATGGVGAIAIVAGVGTQAAAGVYAYTDAIAEKMVGLNESERQAADVESRIAARKLTRKILSAGEFTR